MHTVGLVQVLIIAEVMLEVYKRNLFQGAKKFQSVVGVVGLGLFLYNLPTTFCPVFLSYLMETEMH